MQLMPIKALEALEEAELEDGQFGGYASGVAGTDGTGSGGGGQRNHNSGGATGGDGVVIIKFPASLNITIGSSLSATTDSASVSGFKITTFTSGDDDISFSN